MEKYTSPIEISIQMLDYVSNIMEKIGKLNNYYNLDKMPQLRRNNRIKSIHSSLSIEANSLSFDQVKDVINGKTVLGNREEIIEVQNAYKAYKLIKDINPYNVNDLLKVHGILTKNIVHDSGKFRNSGEGVFDGDKCIFMAPPKDKVPGLINDLLSWLKLNQGNINPLILSSVFHYEFVFIHPFSDGNGRCARLWQNIILANYKEIFEYLPLESTIKKYQEEYYEAIAISHKNGNSNVFIEFMLKMINEVLEDLDKETNRIKNSLNKYINDLLNVLDFDAPINANEIMNKLNIKSKETLRDKYINPALKEGLIKQTLPDKPTSKNQMYFKTNI